MCAVVSECSFEMFSRNGAAKSLGVGLQANGAGLLQELRILKEECWQAMS